jgi:outer membrane receptor protein involved in Fe transport
MSLRGFGVGLGWLVGAVVALSVSAAGQTLRVRVVDASGLPVAGATVSSGTTVVGTTGADGAAEVSVPAGGMLKAASAGMISGLVAAGQGAVLVVRPAAVAEAVTVTTTRSAGVTGEYAETIDALSGEEIRKFPAFTLDESLRQHAGFELYRRASSRVANPTSEGVSLRGLGSTAVSRTLVLEESVPLNDPFGGWIHWDELAPEAVSAVTIATGGGSDLYGSSALGGVIDVAPARPEASFGEIAASGAGQDTSDVSLRVDRGVKDWLGTVSGQGFRTAGYVPVNPASRGPIDVPANVHFQNGHTEIDRAVGASGRAFLMGNVLNEARGNGTQLTNNGTRLWRYVAGDDWSAGDRYSGRIRGFGSDEGYRQTFSSIPASRATESLTRRQRVRVQEIGATTDAAAHFGRLAFVAGADVRDIRANDVETPISAGVVTSLQDTTARQRFAGGFGEVLYERGGWSGAGSVRVDHASNLDTVQRVNGVGTPVPDRAEVVASPRLGLVKRLNEMFSLKAAAFRAFRTPTMNELYRQGQVGQETTQANSGLLSERATGWETGVNAQTPGGRMTGSATYFWTEINRPVSAVLVSQTGTSILDKRENLGQLRSQGLELKAEGRVVRGVVATVGYQFANAVVTKFSAQPSLVGNRLPEVPIEAVTAQLRVTNARAGVFTLAVRRSGQVWDDSANTQSLRGFFEADVYGERSFAGRWTAFGSVENLLNQRADVSRTPVLTLGSGIVAQGGVRVRWGGAQ